jgi:hypothetical protein
MNQAPKTLVKKPSHTDIRDALEHANAIFEDELEQLSFADFDLKYLGVLSVDQLRVYDDVDSWLDLNPGDEEEYSGFRGKEWQTRSKQWLETGIPPILVVRTSKGTVIGDGRGRINFANMMSMKLPVWELVEKNLQEANAIGSGAVVGYGGPLGMDTKPGKKLLWSGDKPLKETFYHGTSSILGLEPGMVLLPPNETEKISEKGRKKNLDRVFFTQDVGSAKIYAGRAVQRFGGKPTIFKIEPEGNVEQLNATPGTTVFMSPKAKIVGRLLESFFPDATNGDTGFFYHATNLENVWGILELGELEPHPPDYGTDQDVWPDGSTALRSYFGSSPKHVDPFYPEGKPILLRIPGNVVRIKKEKGTPDFFTNQPIPSSVIEFWNDNKKIWAPINSIRQ